MYSLNDSYDNLFLIGMPGAGKTSLARGIEAETDLSVLDTDLMRSSSYLSARSFLEREAEIVRDILGESGHVVATDGSYAHLDEVDPGLFEDVKESNYVLFVQRDIRKMKEATNFRTIVSPRPFPSYKDLEKLRVPLYIEASHTDVGLATLSLSKAKNFVLDHLLDEDVLE